MVSKGAPGKGKMPQKSSDHNVQGSRKGIKVPPNKPVAMWSRKRPLESSGVPVPRKRAPLTTLTGGKKPNKTPVVTHRPFQKLASAGGGGGGGGDSCADELSTRIVQCGSPLSSEEPAVVDVVSPVAVLDTRLSISPCKQCPSVIVTTAVSGAAGNSRSNSPTEAVRSASEEPLLNEEPLILKKQNECLRNPESASRSSSGLAPLNPARLGQPAGADELPYYSEVWRLPPCAAVIAEVRATCPAATEDAASTPSTPLSSVKQQRLPAAVPTTPGSAAFTAETTPASVPVPGSQEGTAKEEAKWTRYKLD